jgi:hypothetical protein
MLYCNFIIIIIIINTGQDHKLMIYSVRFNSSIPFEDEARLNVI